MLRFGWRRQISPPGAGREIDEPTTEPHEFVFVILAWIDVSLPVRLSLALLVRPNRLPVSLAPHEAPSVCLSVCLWPFAMLIMVLLVADSF